MRVSYACVAVGALVVAATAVGTRVAATDENPPVAAVSLIAVHDVSDHIEAPESHTAGFSDAATRFAESAIVEMTGFIASAHSAAAKKELADKERAAREALIRSAIESGVNVDLSRFKNDDALSSVGKFIWPVAGARISDHFGTRGGKHAGMDLAAAGGTPITAASPGIVVLSSEAHYGYGVAVIIQHVNGVQTLYGHMTYGSRVVKEGDWVEAGDPIGLVGNTGRSFGDHLHFEVRVSGVAVDPRGYLDGAGDPVVIAPWTPKPGGPPSQAPEPAKADPSATPTPTPTPTGTPTPKPTGTPTPSPTGTPTPSPTGTPTPKPTGTPDPSPTGTPTPGPSPTDPPTTPEPTSPPTTPEPTEPPVSPEPTIPPTTPAPTSPPASPEPTSPPASTAPTEPPPASPKPTQQPPQPPATQEPVSTPEPSASAAPE